MPYSSLAKSQNLLFSSIWIVRTPFSLADRLIRDKVGLYSLEVLSMDKRTMHLHRSDLQISRLINPNIHKVWSIMYSFHLRWRMLFIA